MANDERDRDEVERKRSDIDEETRGLDFLTAGSRVVGAVLLDNRRGRFIAVTARATLSATAAGATRWNGQVARA